MTMTVRNVGEALSRLLSLYQHPTEKVFRQLNARGTYTLEMREMPFVTRYQRPEECVIHYPTRNANPFFHFFEALHMLAGRDDVKFMSHLLARYADYSDDGEVFHGAYGRRIFAFDQVQNVIAEIRRDSDSRRALIAIWQPEHDSGYRGKDMPCNFAVDFKLREGHLHMIVHNRSNDAIWGAYGSNAVQFSFLMQYVAMELDVPLGEYVQVSDSMHVYPDNEPTKTLLREPVLMTDAYWMSEEDSENKGWCAAKPWLEGFEATEDWKADLSLFFRMFDEDKIGSSELYKTDWWQTVAYPMWRSFTSYKQDNMTLAISFSQSIRSTDWQLAALQWLQRIERKRKEQQA